jgi:hypothetical protein
MYLFWLNPAQGSQLKKYKLCVVFLKQEKCCCGFDCSSDLVNVGCFVFWDGVEIAADEPLPVCILSAISDTPIPLIIHNKGQNLV